MSLYRIAEVPDPNGVLADLIEELLDNSALVEVHPDIEAACKRSWDMSLMIEPHEMRKLVNEALGIPEAE